MLSAALLLSGAAVCPAADELGRRATWTPLQPDQVRQQVMAWLDEAGEIDEQTRIKLQALWPETVPEMSGLELLHHVTTTFALVDSRAEAVVQFCRGPRERFAAPQFEILEDENTPPLVRNNLRLLYGRWLSQQQLYDESLAVLDGLKPEDVVDPASLLFYQGVAYHRVLDKDRCLPVISQLLENEGEIPHRYASVAKLMEADLAPLKTDSLDEIARLMDAIRIELEHARAGTRVRKRQEEVLAKLEKLIEELEKRRDNRDGVPRGGDGSQPPSNPLPDSQNAGGSGTGKVPPRDIGSKADWGNLPPKEREEALQQISKDFPSHFREVIEEYFRKLARDNEE